MVRGFGLDRKDLWGTPLAPQRSEIIERLARPNAERLTFIRYALLSGMTEEEVVRLTRMDPWFIGEFATAFAFSAVAAVLFLGGWAVPGIGPDSDIYWVVGPIAMFAKTMFVAFLIFWFRFTYPRFREDQLQRFAWKVLIPLALVNIVATGVLKVVF